MAEEIRSELDESNDGRKDDALNEYEDKDSEQSAENNGVTADVGNQTELTEEKKETYAFRWEYSEQSIYDKGRDDQKKYKRGKGTLVYAIVMTVAFLVAFSILAASLSLNGTGPAVSPQQNAALSTADIVDKCMPSALAIFANNGDGTASMGSGFALTKTGYIMTNYHVVDNASTLWVVDSEYKEYAASLVGYDAELDIAVLFAENANFNPVTIGNSGTVRVGSNVVAIGCPNGEELMFSVSDGIISGVNRYTNDKTSMIQTNAPLNPGNSGGPLFDENGHVIGVVTSKLTSTTVDNGKEIALEGIAFAVAINDAMKLADKLVKADLERPMLGVGGVSVEAGKTYFFVRETGFLWQCVSENGKYYYFDEFKQRVDITDAMMSDGTGIFINAAASGVAIVSVTPGLGAYGVLEVGDIVTSVDGVAVLSTLEVKEVFSRFKPGDKVDITYYRNGKKYDAKMTLKTKAEMLEAEENQ